MLRTAFAAFIVEFPESYIFLTPFLFSRAFGKLVTIVEASNVARFPTGVLAKDGPGMLSDKIRVSLSKDPFRTMLLAIVRSKVREKSYCLQGGLGRPFLGASLKFVSSAEILGSILGESLEFTPSKEVLEDLGVHFGRVLGVQTL